MSDLFLINIFNIKLKISIHEIFQQRKSHTGHKMQGMRHGILRTRKNATPHD